MKIFQNINEFKDSKEHIILTIGMYDGVHLGHQRILKQLVEKAKKNGGKSVLLTFWPHPRKVLQGSVDLNMLSSQEEKLSLLEDFGLDYIVVHPFTKMFSRLNSVDFVRDLLVDRIGVSELVVGYDHHFGRNREGSFEDLERLAEIYGFKLTRVKEQNVGDTTVSSTKIRNALLEGDVKTASKLLNYLYSVEGTVMHGDKIGRTLRFPTANLKVDSEKLIPGNGVYWFRTFYGLTKYNGLINIGTRPTLKGKERRIEAFIFDFDKEIYGKKLKVEFIEKIRDEKKFETTEALKVQIELDSQKVKELINDKDLSNGIENY